VLRPRQQAKLARGAEDEEHAMSPKLNSGIAVIGIDIGKNSFHVVGLDRRGAIVLRQKWSRGQVASRLATMPCCLIGMEACDWRWLDERIEGLSSEIEVLARQDARCDRLMSVPGIGPIVSSAMVAAIGTGDAFRKGRDFAAWLDALLAMPRGPMWGISSWMRLKDHGAKLGNLAAACQHLPALCPRPLGRALATPLLRRRQA
jgi:hypothetical protein